MEKCSKFFNINFPPLRQSTFLPIVYVSYTTLCGYINHVIWFFILTHRSSFHCLFSSVLWLFVTPWNAACQASLSITNSQSLLKLMSIESVMPSNHLILCYPLLLLSSICPSIRVFSNESVLSSGCQSIGASASVLPMNIQDWFPLGLIGLISLLSKGLSGVFSNTTVQKY